MKTIWTSRKRWLFFGLPFTFTRYSLTEEKFILNVGFLNKREEEIRLYRILDLSLRRSLFQRMFGLGTITCKTSDKTVPILIVKNIKDSQRVKELISDLVEKERVRKRVTSREYYSAGGYSADAGHGGDYGFDGDFEGVPDDDDEI